MSNLDSFAHAWLTEDLIGAQPPKQKWLPTIPSNVTETIRYLTEGSVWIDEQMRTIIVWRIHWKNVMNVESVDLLIIPDMKIVHGQPAKQIEQFVREGILQYCKDCQKVYKP